jgi:hypothetical protein
MPLAKLEAIKRFFNTEGYPPLENLHRSRPPLRRSPRRNHQSTTRGEANSRTLRLRVHQPPVTLQPVPPSG